MPYRQIRGGITALSVEMRSPWRDYQDAQWLTVFHAWNGRVLLPGEHHLVPPDHTWFATCLLLAPRFWRDDNKVKEWFAMTCRSPSKLAAIMTMIMGQRVRLDRYISGEIIFVQPVIVERDGTVSANADSAHEHLFNTLLFLATNQNPDVSVCVFEVKRTRGRRDCWTNFCSYRLWMATTTEDRVSTAPTC